MTSRHLIGGHNGVAIWTDNYDCLSNCKFKRLYDPLKEIVTVTMPRRNIVL